MRMIGFPGIRMAVSSMTDFRRRKAAIKEPETVAWLREGLARHGPFTLLDIGANVGGYSLIACALDPGIRAVAVEPFPPTFATLCHNIALNGLAERIIPVHGFFGAEAGQLATLSTDRWASGLAEHPASGRYRLSLPTHDIAALRSYIGDGPLLAKIDVDGGEDVVMEGLLPALAEPRLKSLILECDSADIDRFAALLARFGLSSQSRHGKENQRQLNLIASREADAARAP